MHHRLGIDSVNDVPEGKTDREDGLILPILRQIERPPRPFLSGLHEPLVVQEGRVLLTLPGWSGYKSLLLLPFSLKTFFTPPPPAVIG